MPPHSLTSMTMEKVSFPREIKWHVTMFHAQNKNNVARWKDDSRKGSTKSTSPLHGYHKMGAM